LQETIIVRSIEDLLSRITVLEATFAERPGDVEEQRRRSDLIRYAVILPPLDWELTSLQQVRKHRGTTAALL
jgi:hypothetical protein